MKTLTIALMAAAVAIAIPSASAELVNLETTADCGEICDHVISTIGTTWEPCDNGETQVVCGWHPECSNEGGSGDDPCTTGEYYFCVGWNRLTHHAYCST